MMALLYALTLSDRGATLVIGAIGAAPFMLASVAMCLVAIPLPIALVHRFDRREA